MKKALKIIGITLASVLVLVLLAVTLLTYIVFSPKHLTPIVNRATDTLITCPSQVDKVELTFFRTFPRFGAELQGLTIINPTEGAQSDTLLHVDELLISFDLKKAINGDIYIYKFNLEGVEANPYIAADGSTNFDILNLPADTTEKDTTSSEWKLRSIGCDCPLVANAKHLSFLDEKDTIDAGMDDFVLTLAESEKNNRKGAALSIDADAIRFAYKNEQWASNLKFDFDMTTWLGDTLDIESLSLAINEFALNLDGHVFIPDWHQQEYHCDLNITTNDWQISSLLALLPQRFAAMIPQQIDADGKLNLEAHAYGCYIGDTLPQVDARLRLNEGHGHYDLKVLPYEFQSIAADMDVHADLNQKQNCTAQIHKIFAATGETSISLEGQVKDIFAAKKEFELVNPLCDIVAQLNVNLEDAKTYIDNNQLEGTLLGKVNVRTRLNDVLDFNLNKMAVESDLTIRSLAMVWADSIHANAESLHLMLKAPKKGIKNKNILSADCTIGLEKLHATMPSMDIYTDGGELNAAAEINRADSTAVPNLVGRFDLRDLTASLDTIHAYAQAPKGKLQLQPSLRNKKQPRINVSLSAHKLNAEMGKGLIARTGDIDIEASAVYDKKADNVFLKWNPRLSFDLEDAQADIAMIGTPITIPQVKFSFSNRECKIDTSRIVIGNSDFSLAGDVKGLGKWLKKQGKFEGALRFTSDHTNVNELLEIANRVTSSTGQTEATTTAENTVASKEANPFMVPLNTDLTLTTVIREADVFNEHLTNLGGNLYIRDGVVILEEIGFICEAAKLQLTAMYRTPKRNHIYVGLDYHMIDIDLQKLISMVPQLDTLVPMLSAFRGKAQFHIAAETYVNEKYELKPSTIRGACAIEGKDLVVLDSETFSKISKILMFSPKTENKIDSISTQITVYKNEITVYPFCLSMDNYMVAVGGNHFLDMTFNYHASLLKPFYLGVDVMGNLDDLQIKPAKCRYAKDFRPLFHRDVDQKAAEMRNTISASLKKNVKIQ